MYINKANFFWHGKALSLYEYACISSFVKNGFDVNVYSYDELRLPGGSFLCDATEILPITDLKKYTQAGLKGNLAAFSDAFRYQLIKKKGGWWFDSDVLCLASSDDFVEIFKNKEIKLSLGYQAQNDVAVGVLYIDDNDLLQTIIDRLESVGTDFQWGEIGPKLVTGIINELDINHLVDPKYYFYPIYKNFQKMFDPLSVEWCKERVSKSFTLHLWNDLLRRYKIPKNIMPPSGSYLHEIFLNLCPELVEVPTLQFDTLQVLFDYYDQKEHCERLLYIEKKIKDNCIISALLKMKNILK